MRPRLVRAWRPPTLRRLDRRADLARPMLEDSELGADMALALFALEWVAEWRARGKPRGDGHVHIHVSRGPRPALL